MSDLDVIKEIENIIGEELRSRSTEDGFRGGYLLDTNKKVVDLSFHECTFNTIDPLKKLKNLKSLDLSHTHIKNVSALKEILSLTKLDLTHSNFRDIRSLQYLTNLTELNLSGNQISDISVLKALPNLTKLDLRYNQVSDISFLKALPNLTKLDLRYNQISVISVPKALPNLTKLYLSSNHISDISFLKALPNLTELDLSSNHISDISVLKVLPNLAGLYLEHNQIRDINVLKNLPNLTSLYLRNNEISELPEWLLNFNIPIKWIFHGGSAIYLQDNPIEQPPLEIVKQGNEAIRAYFEQLRKDGTDYIYEAKLILVGEGGAGKTSLANKIINPDWQLIPENELQSTQGIDILKYKFPYKDKTFNINIWDFAGQEIYHHSHQFFLTKRTLYFFVIEPPPSDDGSENQEILKDNENPDYWFNTVNLLSNKSPILIIKNEKQNRPCVIEENKLRYEFNNIKDSFSANLSDNRGLPEIVKALQYYITDLPHIGSPLPKTWVKVRKQLEQDSRYYIDLKEYFAICQTNGFEKEADKLQLSEYLHDLGVCLHFQNHPLLLKTLILKPTWATDAVYKVLDNDTVKNQAGHFNDKDLADIWQDEQYNTMRGELLALMQKFKLCYEIRNQPQHYIAPQLLKDKSPQYEWQSNDNLLLRYKYDFMPKGILSQFIVEMHEYIANNYQWVWKSGVVLEMDNTEAEIIEYYGKRDIHIRVHGSNKKELLNIVSYELDKINGSYERLKDKCKKLIPCNCEKCHDTQEPHFFEYEELKERIAYRSYQIECRKPPFNKVNVLKLIDDIEIPNLLAKDNELEQERKHKDLLADLLKDSMQRPINIHNNLGNKIMNIENQNIHGGNQQFADTITNNSRHQSFNGTATNSNVNFGDNSTQTNTVNNQGMSKEEFLQLLQTFKQDLSKSGLPGDTVEEAISDIEAVEKQLQKTEPNKSIVSRKLESINGVLEDANNTIDAATKGYETFNKIVQVGKILLGGIGFLG